MVRTASVRGVKRWFAMARPQGSLKGQLERRLERSGGQSMKGLEY